MRRLTPGIPLIALLWSATLHGGGAAWPARENPFAVRPFRPHGEEGLVTSAICYGPHRDGQRPGGPTPSAAELRADVRLMAPHWRLLRIYGSVEFAQTLLMMIQEEKVDLQVMLGVWIAPDDEAGNRREADAAIRLANAFPDLVAAVCVGNETQISWSAHRCSPEVLIEQVRRVRAAVGAPVTVADDFNFWNKPASRAVAEEIDFITMHAHPLWNGRQLEEALPWLNTQLAEVGRLHPDRDLVLGETGWATSVHDEGEQAELIKGRPGEVEQKQFYDAVREWAAAEQATVFFFEAFDENWKGGPHPAEVEKHWGLFRADRTPKAAVAAGPPQD